jgi:hypothetical protein
MPKCKMPVHCALHIVHFALGFAEWLGCVYLFTRYTMICVTSCTSSGSN